MLLEERQLEAAIAALEAQRALLGDGVVDALLAAARAKLATLAASAEPPAQMLKQVSILFLDLVGSTALAEPLDPETVSAVMDDALARGTAIVQAHRGKVLQYAGDSILAAFGADEAREDDVENAVHCGLALLELGKALGAEVQAAHRYANLNVRVGIHTGGVLLGGGVDTGGTIRGAAVNLAARMEQSAPAGALRISHDTYTQVRGLFEVDAQPPLSVKGVDAPVQSYLVRRAKPRQFRIGTRGIEGVATRMVGRDAELQAVQAAYLRLFECRKLAAVTVVGDAGIGKSRLLYEFEAWSEARPESFFLFRGRATPATATRAYGLLRDILAWRFQIADDDSLDAARQKLLDGITPLFLHDDGPDLAEAHAHVLGHLIGIDWRSSRHLRGILDDPQQIRNRAFHAAAQIFRRVSASEGGAVGTPVILQLDDLHWADGESLDFLDHLIAVNLDVPLLVLTFARSTLFERQDQGRAIHGLHHRIDLQPLDKRASRDLADELLKKLPEIPAALRELLIGSAEGNPFYMEELVKMLIDQGAIRTRSGGDDTWSVDAERLLVTRVPPTLTGVLQARLDGLPVQERHALQQASVVGAVFWDRALSAVDEQAGHQLPALVQRELALPRVDALLPAQIEGLREFAFRHQVLHQVTYDTVIKRKRREGHAKVAQWLAGVSEQGGLHAGDLLGLAAEHYEQADDGANAATFHARAAEHAAERFAHDRVLAHVDRALALLGEPAPHRLRDQAELRWRLLCAREQTLHLQARRDEQAADLDSLARLADALDDDRRRADMARRRGLRAMRMADWPATESAARHGVACATQAGDDGLRLQSLRLLGAARIMQGDVDAGRVLMLQGAAEARQLELPGVEARFLNVLSVAAEMQGDAVGRLALDQQILRKYREAGDRVNEAIALSNLGGGWMNLGGLAQARHQLDAALQLLRANGDRTMEGNALGSLSVLARWQGQGELAFTLAKQALDIAVATQALGHEINGWLRLAEAELALGRYADARRAYTQAKALALASDDPLQHDAGAGLACVALAEGDTAAALAALQPVFDLVAAGGTLDGTEERKIELDCHQALARAGDPRAADWLARAHAALRVQADAISDAALRQSFLQNIPQHRDIVAAWGQLGACSAEHGRDLRGNHGRTESPAPCLNLSARQ